MDWLSFGGNSCGVFAGGTKVKTATELAEEYSNRECSLLPGEHEYVFQKVKETCAAHFLAGFDAGYEHRVDLLPTALKKLQAAEIRLKIAREALESISAEKCEGKFEDKLGMIARGGLISIIDTDTAIAREALRKIGETHE